MVQLEEGGYESDINRCVLLRRHAAFLIVKLQLE
jgi:hypothetical protein